MLCVQWDRPPAANAGTSTSNAQDSDKSGKGGAATARAVPKGPTAKRIEEDQEPASELAKLLSAPTTLIQQMQAKALQASPFRGLRKGDTALV